MPVPGLGELLEKGISRVGGEGFGETFGRSVRSMDHHVFNQSSVNRFTGDLLQKYQMRVDQNTSKLAAGVKGLNSSQLRSHAAGVAAAETFGNNYEVLTALVKHSHETQGYYMTQNLMDHIGMVLHEDAEIGGSKHVSKSKAAAVPELEKYPDFKIDPKTGQRPIDPKTGEPARYRYNITSDYHKPGEVEQWTNHMVVSRVAPMIVLPHVGTTLNNVWGTQTLKWMKGFGQVVSGQTPQQIRDTIIAAGLQTEGTMRAMRQMENVRRGIITRFLPGSMQDVIGKLSPTPFFGSLRDFQINWTAVSTYHDAFDYAEKFAHDPSDGLARRRLAQYGMTPQDLNQIEKTGKLTPEQHTKAVYYGVDRKVFLNTAMQRSYYSQANALSRNTTMFHGYISKQVQFMSQEFRTAFEKESRSPGGIAKAMLVAGVLFPAVGEGIKLLEMTGRGQLAEIPNQAEEDYRGITLQKGNSAAAKVGNAILTYGEAYACLGAFGIFYELFMGAHRGALVLGSHLLGPAAGRATQYIADTVHSVESLAQGKTDEKYYNPAIRDFLELAGAYGTGHFIANMFFPTQAEKKRAKDQERDPMSPKRGKGFNLSTSFKEPKL